VGGTPLTTPISGVVLLNDFSRVTMRLTYDQSPSGRFTVDLTIRRGSRLVEIVFQSAFSATLGVVRATNEAGTLATGYVRATSDDIDGNRYIVGSPQTFTDDLTAGGVSKAAATRLYAFVGAEFGGAAAVDGDQADDVVNQYMAALAEEVVGVPL
jgi:hypothetical protein